jgi:UrcA family protein
MQRTATGGRCGRLESDELTPHPKETAMKLLITCVTLGLVAASAVGTARAESTPETRSVAVQYGDLDKNSARGARVLYGRLYSAALFVCQDLHPGIAPYLDRARARCIRGALQGAITRVDSPALAAFAAAHGVIPGAQGAVASR